MKKSDYRYATICDWGRIIIPKTVRDQLKWSKGSFLTATPNTQDGMLSLSAAEQGTVCITSSAIDELGRYTLPGHVLQSLGWAAGDTLYLAPNQDCTAAIIVRYEQLKEHDNECVICKKPETILEVNDLGVCYRCAKYISEALQRAM